MTTPFNFTDQNNVALSSTITSNTITVAGGGGDISIVNGTYSINGGAYTSSPGTVSNDDTVAVRHTSSSSYNNPAQDGETETVLTIDDQSDSFKSYTIAKPTNVPTNAPRVRNINAKTLTTVIGGVEPPYDVYRFSGRRFFEKPGHNPFDGL